MGCTLQFLMRPRQRQSEPGNRHLRIQPLSAYVGTYVRLGNFALSPNGLFCRPLYSDERACERLFLGERGVYVGIVGRRRGFAFCPRLRSLCARRCVCICARNYGARCSECFSNYVSINHRCSLCLCICVVVIVIDDGLRVIEQFIFCGVLIYSGASCACL